MISKGFFISLFLTLSLFTTNIYAENNYRLKTYEAPFYQGTTHKIFPSDYHSRRCRPRYYSGYYSGYYCSDYGGPYLTILNEKGRLMLQNMQNKDYTFDNILNLIFLFRYDIWVLCCLSFIAMMGYRIRNN